MFGCAVSINGDYALIGTNEDNNDTGSAYVFKRNGTTWTEEQKLTASDGNNWDQFGISVAIDGGYAIIGAWEDDDNGKNSGSAYVFKRNGTTWTEEQKLTASDGNNWDHFGYSVSIDGDYAVIGAGWDDDNGEDSGSAYIFKRNGTSWIQHQKLTASDGGICDLFGKSVSIDKDYIAIVAPYCNDYTNSTVYVFKRNNSIWVEEAKLIVSDPSADLFSSVSINGKYVLIGDYYGNNDTGSAYVFKRNGTSWSQQATLIASDGEKYDNFGYSVSIDKNYAIVGAWKDKGSAYIFERNGTTWAEEQKLTASDGESGDQFGISVAIDDNYAVIGAGWDDDNGDSSGSAYIFRRNQPPDIPTIDGPTSGKARRTYFYTAVTIDLENDKIAYLFNWGDGTTSGWTDFFPSGTEASASHSWKEGNYDIRVKAKDDQGLESRWSNPLSITIPRNKVSFNSLILRFLERFIIKV